MRKPKKPTRQNQERVICHDIVDDWDGLAVSEVMVLLGNMLADGEKSVFRASYSYDDNVDFMIIGIDSDETFDNRMKQYEEDMIAWRIDRIDTLKRELEEAERA